MSNKLTLGWLRRQTKDLPDDTLIGYGHGWDIGFGPNKDIEPTPYDDMDVNGDRYLFQVDPETGILVLGYNF